MTDAFGLYNLTNGRGTSYPPALTPAVIRAIKDPVRVVTSADITLFGLQTIDGVALAEDNRVLVRGQTDKTQNGVYTAQSGAWVRSLDFSKAEYAGRGTLVWVTDGTVYGGSLWVLDTADGSPLIFGTSQITWKATSLTAETVANINTLITAGIGEIDADDIVSIVAALPDIETTADNMAAVLTTANISAAVSTVANISAAVSAVAEDAEDLVVVGQSISALKVPYGTRAAVEADTISASVSSIEVTKYDSDSDVAPQVYERTGDQTGTAMGIQSADGAWWKPVREVWAKACGVRHNVPDQGDALQRWINATTDHGVPGRIEAGFFFVEKQLNWTDDETAIQGAMLCGSGMTNYGGGSSGNGTEIRATAAMNAILSISDGAHRNQIIRDMRIADGGAGYKDTTDPNNPVYRCGAAISFDGDSYSAPTLENVAVAGCDVGIDIAVDGSNGEFVSVRDGDIRDCNIAFRNTSDQAYAHYMRGGQGEVAPNGVFFACRAPGGGGLSVSEWSGGFGVGDLSAPLYNTVIETSEVGAVLLRAGRFEKCARLVHIKAVYSSVYITGGQFIFPKNVAETHADNAAPFISIETNAWWGSIVCEGATFEGSGGRTKLKIENIGGGSSNGTIIFRACRFIKIDITDLLAEDVNIIFDDGCTLDGNPLDVDGALNARFAGRVHRDPRIASAQDVLNPVGIGQNLLRDLDFGQSETDASKIFNHTPPASWNVSGDGELAEIQRGPDGPNITGENPYTRRILIEPGQTIYQTLRNGRINDGDIVRLTAYAAGKPNGQVGEVLKLTVSDDADPSAVYIETALSTQMRVIDIWRRLNSTTASNGALRFTIENTADTEQAVLTYDLLAVTIGAEARAPVPSLGAEIERTASAMNAQNLFVSDRLQMPHVSDTCGQYAYSDQRDGECYLSTDDDREKIRIAGAWRVRALQPLVSDDQGDADTTLTTSSDRVIIYDTVLTADRTVSLPTTGMLEGDWFVLERHSGATGAFDLFFKSGSTTIHTLATAGKKAAVRYDGTNWRPAGSGDL